jgi:quercetin dioxygenase-like cupin family protein
MGRVNTMQNLGYKLIMLLVLVVCLGSLPSFAAEEKSSSVMLRPDELKWMDGPPSLPPGAKMVLIEGVLNNPTPFTFRLKLPANYKLPLHTHHAIEHVTVLSGTLNFSAGEKTDPANARAFPAGSILIMPAGTPMFGWAEGETILQVHGVGPWGISYINPEEDPRKK